MSDVIVIGAGLAGLTAAWQVAAAGKRVNVVAKGWGATHWHAGCVDVLGYLGGDQQVPCESPEQSLAELTGKSSAHPYALLGLPRLEESLNAFKALFAAAGYPLQGDLSRNWLLPSAVGAVRPTCLAPETMTAGDLRRDEPMLLVGFRQVNDFYAGLAAANLTAQGHWAEAITLDLDSLRRPRRLNPVLLARMFEQPVFVAEVAQAIRPHLGGAGRVGLPAVLGLDRPLEVMQSLSDQLGLPVFEIPMLPPSVPGMRLHQVLMQTITRLGGRIYDGMEVLDADCENGRVTQIYSEAAARRRPHRGGTYILATGGLLGGGITTNHLGEVRETIFDLPLQAPPNRLRWFRQDFFDDAGHPIYRVGIDVDDQFRPIGTDGVPIYENLLAAGTTLSSNEALRERSFEGIAAATGFWAGRKAAELA